VSILKINKILLVRAKYLMLIFNFLFMIPGSVALNSMQNIDTIRIPLVTIEDNFYPEDALIVAGLLARSKSIAFPSCDSG